MHTYNMVRSLSGSSARKIILTLNPFLQPDEHYLVQTPSGGIVFGGGVEKLEREGKMRPDETLGVVDDSTIIPKVEQGLSRPSLATDIDRH
jgi:hypothetical protein